MSRNILKMRIYKKNQRPDSLVFSHLSKIDLIIADLKQFFAPGPPVMTRRHDTTSEPLVPGKAQISISASHLFMKYIGISIRSETSSYTSDTLGTITNYSLNRLSLKNYHT